MAKQSFDAVLLAGGRSTRMGTDKAGVLIQGEPLWRRQLATLRALAPSEIFISGRDTGPYAGAGLEILKDAQFDRGPLAGLATALAWTTKPYLVVLAIDLPAMRADFLARLVELAIRLGRSVVPRNGPRFEPLAAVYSKATRGLVAECLQSGDYSLQRFIRLAIEKDLAEVYPLSLEDEPLLRNVNAPADLF
jgi:molybdopterin-guanine dinucleotide biosynthesis protein A